MSIEFHGLSRQGGSRSADGRSLRGSNSGAEGVVCEGIEDERTCLWQIRSGCENETAAIKSVQNILPINVRGENCSYQCINHGRFVQCGGSRNAEALRLIRFAAFWESDLI
jgi:hypothetical protein